MSEAPKIKRATPIQRTVLYIIILVVVVMILVLGYFGGSFALPGSIKSAYQDKNCESVIKLDGIYTGIYPVIIADKSIADLVRECAVFTVAIANEEQEAWRDSYNAFNVYSETYPNGLFTAEAHEHSAVGLIGLVKEEIDQKKYVEAIGNLNLIMVDYKDTKVAAEATSLIPEIYIAWGTDLRDKSDFMGAERIFIDLKTWAESSQKTELAKSAQYDLAQTYLDWGLSLEAQKQFEDAKLKLDIALSTDPEPQSSSGPASQVKANEPKFFDEWGDYFVEQKDFARAIEQYKTAVSLAKGNEQSAAVDAVANGYIQWADSLSAEEDFLGALRQLDFAKENVSTDSMKKSVDSARERIYLAFSQSSGAQASQAMQDAAKIVCEQHKKPDLPIFGLDKETLLASVYGTDQKLPENVLAITPGEMHYVACVEETSSIIERKVAYITFLLIREQYAWNISLRRSETGEEVETTYIEGGVPLPLPTTPYDIAQGGHNQHFYGAKPDIAELANWLQTVLK